MKHSAESIFRKDALFLAPLAGYTDTAFRQVLRGLGADAVVTEMVNAFGLTLEKKKSRTSKYVVYDESEHPIGIQIFGNDPEKMAEAGKIGEQLGFDFVDVNMGCPVRKVMRTGAGAALLRTPELAGKIVEKLKSRLKVPVSVKIRVGWTPDDSSHVEAVAAMRSAGVDAVIVHGRPVSHGMTGPVLTGKIAEIKDRFPELFVVANGGIETNDDLERMKGETGCDAFMIGRAALKDPLVFLKLRGTPNERIPDKGGVVIRHFELHMALYGERGPVLFRKFISWYSKGLPGSSDFRNRINRIEDPQEMRGEIQRFFKPRHAHT